MCERCHDSHDEPNINDFGVEDVAGASLVMLGVLVENYLQKGYCDPTMYKALGVAREFAERLAQIAEEDDNTGVAEQARQLATSFELTRIEAGEVMNQIIEEHDLPVKKNTFELDEERLAEMLDGAELCDCEDCDCEDGED